MSKDKVLLCFCKHPVPGLVKSRLAKDLGEEQAAEVYKLMLEETVKNICSTSMEVFLYCYPDINHPILHAYQNKFNLALKPQLGEDLGMKMHHAIKNHLNNKTNVVLIGTDCLEIDTDYIDEAFEKLNTGFDIVLGPAIDGGYALIGASKIDKTIFQNISWSSDMVLKQTEEQIRSLGWKYYLLKPVRDLDHLEDYEYFSTHTKYRGLF